MQGLLSFNLSVATVGVGAVLWRGGELIRAGQLAPEDLTAFVMYAAAPSPDSAARSNAVLGLCEKHGLEEFAHPRQGPVWRLVMRISSEYVTLWLPAAFINTDRSRGRFGFKSRAVHCTLSNAA